MSKFKNIISFAIVLLSLLFAIPPKMALADYGSIGSAFCATSGTHRGNLTFTIRNTSFYPKTYQVTVGPHGDNHVRVAGNTSRAFTLRGIPEGSHTARLKRGSTTLNTKYGVRFSCTPSRPDTASVGPAACSSSGGTHRGQLSFVITNASNSRRTYRVTVGPHGDNNVHVSANTRRTFTLRGIPSGMHTARVYFGNSVLMTKHYLNFACSGVDQASIGTPSCAVPGGRNKGELQFRITNRSSSKKSYRVVVGPHADNNVWVDANRTRTFTLRGIPSEIHTASVYYGNHRMQTKYNLNFKACATKYDDLGQTACHNCYERQYTNTIDEALRLNKAIEIDFYDTAIAFPPSMRNNWFVAHWQNNPYENNCSGNQTLRACLQDIKNWSDNNRNAEVLTVYLDKKSDWGGLLDARSPDNLDNLIEDVITRERLYRPADLKGNFTTLRSAAIANNWKTTSELRGKIIFVLTGGAFRNHNKTQNHYIEKRMDNANMFVAVDLDEKRDFSLTGKPEGFTNITKGYLVFYNLKQDNFRQEWTNETRRLNYVTRLWWAGDDTGRDFCDFMNKGITQPAFFQYWKQDRSIQSVDLNDPRNPCRRI